MWVRPSPIPEGRLGEERGEAGIFPLDLEGAQHLEL
jgi:hypothetical protein